MGATLDKWSPEDIERARVLFMEERRTVSACAKALGVTRSAMAGVCRRQGWFGTDNRRTREPVNASDPIYTRRRVFDLGEPIRSSTQEVEGMRLHRKRDAEFSAMVLREAVRTGQIRIVP